MAETYCGKSCEFCQWKEELQCGGCKNGPGQPLYGDCKLAICCREKRHETCETCMDRGSCWYLSNKLRLPEMRLQKQEAAWTEHRKTAEEAPRLAKLLGILFWLVIPNLAAGVLTQDVLTSRVPALMTVGSVLEILCSAVYCVVLLRLAFASGRYRTSGCCMVAVTVLNAAMLLLGSSELGALLLVVAAVVGVVGEYLELHAHADVLEKPDPELSQCFLRLWKLYLISYAASIGGVILIIVVPLVGSLVALGGVIAMAVAAVKKLVYLHRAWVFFRDYGTEE